MADLDHLGTMIGQKTSKDTKGAGRDAKGSLQSPSWKTIKWQFGIKNVFC